MCILPEVGYHPVDKEGLSLFIALRWMQDPGWVMVGLTENIQACLRDFQTGTASMARKRHLASTARGFLMFLSYGLIGQLLHIALRCLEGSTLSNLVHRRRRCARISKHTILCLEGSTPEDRGLSLFIALRWMQDPAG